MPRPAFPRPAVLIVLVVCMFAVGSVFVLAQDDTGDGPLVGTITYTVQPRDVLDSIAARYDVSLQCLVDLNELQDPNLLFPGETLTISDECPLYQGEAPVIFPREARTSGEIDQGGGAVPATTLPGLSPDGQTYTLQVGDTLDEIGRELNISVIALLEANGNPRPQDLRVGEEIVIPADAPPYGVYPALFTTVDELGQGGGAPAPGETVHVVQPQEVLDLLAAAYDADLACIVVRNELDTPAYIYPGQVIFIPADCPAYSGLSFRPTLRPQPGQGGLGPASEPEIEPTLAPTTASNIAPTQESFVPLAAETEEPAALTPATAQPATIVGTEEAVG